MLQKSQDNSMKTSFVFIKNMLDDEGYTLTYPLEDNYITFKTKRDKIEYTCPNGHNNSILLQNWKAGRRCKDCADQKKKLCHSVLQEEFSKRGCTLLTKEDDYDAVYKQKMSYVCPNKHNHSIRYQDFVRGHGCPECTGQTPKTLDFIKKSFNDVGYTLLTERYKNNKQYLRFICPSGHEHKIRWDDWQRGVRCGICDTSKMSKEEKSLTDYIKSLGFGVIENDRSVISPLELDTVIPEKLIAIEYCGLYWHGETKGKDSKYHINKLNSCKEKGYRLITIFSDEWVNKQDTVKTRLKHILGINDDVIYARKCDIRVIDTKTSTKFVNEHHIQGSTGSSVKLGLFHNSELVSVMTFAKGSISKGKGGVSGVYELSRFCSSRRVVGGASKLLTYFKRNYEWDEIFTYADKRWSDGNLYEQIGFECVGETKPNYWYFKTSSSTQKRGHRFNYRKDRLPILFENVDMTMTEWQIMQSQGFDRIWDCGNIKYRVTNDFTLYK